MLPSEGVIPAPDQRGHHWVTRGQSAMIHTDTAKEKLAKTKDTMSNFIMHHIV